MPSSAIDPETPEYERDYTLSGTLKVWYDNDEHFEELEKAFNALYPNIKLEYERVAHTDARAKMQLDGPAGLGADVFMLPHDHLGNAIFDGLVEPIDETLQRKLEDSLVASAVRTVTFEDGYMYVVPVVIENIALLYNKDLWGENPPETMEEIIEFAKTYNDPATGKWAMAWPIDDPYHNYHWLSAFGMKIFGENHRDYTKPGFDTPEALEGVRYIEYLRKNLFDAPAGDAGTAVSSFTKGEMPFTITGPWSYAAAVRNEVNFGVAKLPTIGGRQPICFSGLRTAAMSSFTKEFELATAYLDFLSSVEGATVFFEAEGMLPALADHSLVPGLSDDPYLSGMGQQTPFTVPMPLIPEMNIGGWNGLRDTFFFTWEGQLTPEESQEKGMETYKLALQTAGRDVNF
jgi:arabinogalactan oligomer/maltooligosaccharide transport system substrate-binding protein